MRKYLLILAVLLFVGCAAENSATTEAVATVEEPETTTPSTYSMIGFVQKGPFISGSSVTIQELDDDLEPTGVSYQTTTNDDLGSFSLGSSISTQYVEIIAIGYYYNEVSGGISSSTLTLRAISKLSDAASCNINLLTTLEKERLKTLVLGGEDFTAARTQAETEILSVFKISGISGTFDSMDITELGEQNKALMAVTAILQTGNTVGELSELISQINLDIKSDGTLDDPILITEILTNSQNVDPAAIKANLQERYGALGVTVTVGTFESYVDLDGDGILEKDDDNTPDAFSFTNKTGADVSTSYESNEVTISGLSDGGIIKITGTAYKNGFQSTDFNVANGDKIKFVLTSSANYEQTVSGDSITINGVEYSFSVTTKADDRQQIIVFDSAQPDRDGAFGFANAESWCSTQATALGLSGTIIPYLSSDAIGVGDLGTESFSTKITEDSVNPRKVTSTAGGLIASRWSKFFDNESTDSFATLGVTDSDYWTGMVSSSSNKGRTTYNCNQWSSNGDGAASGLAVDHANINTHTVGNRTINDPRGIETRYCNQTRKILCIAF